MIDGRGPALLDDIAGQVRMRHIPEDATVPTLVYLKDCRNVTQIFTEVLFLCDERKNRRFSVSLSQMKKNDDINLFSEYLFWDVR